MTRKGFYIDESRCINCWTCEIACSDWNDIRPEEWSDEAVDVKWLDLMRIEEGDFGDLDVKVFPLPCGHCEGAPCVEAAPDYAFRENPVYTREEDNLVFISPERLPKEEDDQVRREEVVEDIVEACPFDRIQVGDVDMPATSGYPEGKPAGLPQKCTGCFDREEPACAQACPTGAIQFGDFDELQAEYPDADRSLLREIFGDEAVDEADPAIIIED